MSVPVDADLMRRDLYRDEGIRRRPYEDTEGILTIGVGHNLTHGLDDDVIDHQLSNDIARAIRGLDRNIPWWRELPDEPRRRAICNMSFQLGINGLLLFRKMIAALKKGDYELAKIEALDSRWARKQSSTRAERVARAIETGK